MLWGIYYAILLIWEKKSLLSAFKRMPKAVSFVLTHIYTVFVTVFGFAIFYFDKDLWRNLGYLFGIGCTGFSDIFTASVIMDNIVLLAAAVILSVPVFPMLFNALKAKGILSYPAERIIKTVIVIAFVSLATIRLVGNSYTAFLYFRF